MPPAPKRNQIALATCLLALAAIIALAVGLVARCGNTHEPRSAYVEDTPQPELTTYAPTDAPQPKATPEPTNTPQPTDTAPYDIEIGETISFGGIDWLVLDVQDDRALLITKNVIETRRYHSSYPSVTWEICELRAYLNGTGAYEGKGFIDRFSAQQRARIQTVDNANPNNPRYNTRGGNVTQDQVFLLSIEEVVEYFGDSGQLGDPNAYYIGDEYNYNRVAKYNGRIHWWWLRSPGYGSNWAAGVDYGGGIGIGGCPVYGEGRGVRPALWLAL